MVSGLDVGWFELPLDDTGTSFKMQSSLNSDGVVSGLLKVSRAQKPLLMKSPNTSMIDKQQYSQKWIRWCWYLCCQSATSWGEVHVEREEAKSKSEQVVESLTSQQVMHSTYNITDDAGASRTLYNIHCTLQNTTHLICSGSQWQVMQIPKQHCYIIVQQLLSVEN